MQSRKKSGGRQVGTPNKVTSDARRAVATFVDGNVHRLAEWLDGVASGVKDDSGHYLVAPNPSKAFQLFQSIMEYHIPKLGRMEVVGDYDSPVEIEHNSTVFAELLKNLKMRRQAEK